MQYWGITDPGCVRPQNQDAFKMEQLDKNALLCVVCDGMGGAKSGNVASTLAVDVFTQEVLAAYKSGMSFEQMSALMLSAGKTANTAVYTKAQQGEEFRGMGTTLVAALIQGKCAAVLNVGDSRAYRINRGGIRRVTTDHSVVELMIQRGEVTQEEARHYPGRNLITRAVGTESDVKCDLFRLDLDRGDCVLLCSDGLTNLVDDQEILFEVVHGANKQRCCQSLLKIAQNRGAPDNVTCVLVQL
jgi:protein phosphatase